MTQTVYIMVGPTGSGKTRYAEALSKSTGAVRIGTDMYRGKKLNDAVAAALETGKDVIVNSTLPKQARREDFALIARQYGARTKCIRMDANKKTAAKRSSLKTPAQRYTVAGKFFQEFEQLGDECDEKEIVPVEPIVNKTQNKTNEQTKRPRTHNQSVNDSLLSFPNMQQNVNGNQHLYIMIGPSGAGKSTYAKRLAALADAIVVSSDTYKSVRTKIDKAVRESLQTGKSVIVDATHPTRERREQLAKIARAAGVSTRCLHRDADRKVAEGRSKLGEPVVFFASSKYHKSFEPPGSECDKVHVIRNSNVVIQSAPSAANISGSKRKGTPQPTPQPTSSGSTNTYVEKKPKTAYAVKKPKTAYAVKANAPRSTVAPLNNFRPRSTVAPQAMLAERYNPDHHTGEFYASEKLDGIRALAVDRVLYTRSGNVINAPAWFLSQLPLGTFDGELYAGRGRFDQVSSTVMKKTPVDSEWKQIQYRIFDDHASETTFSKTLERLQKVLPPCMPGIPVCVVSQAKVEGHNTIQKMHKAFETLGGEGLILRRNVRYAPGVRTQSMLKVKGALEQEARVTGFNLKPDGSIKSFQMRFVNGPNAGVEFNLAVQSERKKAQIRIGDVLTVEFFEYTKTGKPRFPRFKTVRKNIAYN